MKKTFKNPWLIQVRPFKLLSEQIIESVFLFRLKTEYAFEHEHTDSSSSDSEEDCADERWMQDDD